MSGYGVEAVERALRLLDAFDDDQATFELRDLAARTGFSKPMIIRLTASLERYGHIQRDGEGRYRLGSSLWRLGSRYRRHFSLENVIRPILRDMVAKTGETAVFYARAGDKRICLYRQNSSRRARHHVEIGEQLPLDAGAAGHLILAFSGENGALYDRIRERGYIASHGERDPDVSGIAAPVFRERQSFVGALIVSGLRSRVEPSVDKLVPVVVEAAKQASAALGHGSRALEES